MSSIFVTATGTDLGKTYLIEKLLNFDSQLYNKITAIKPIESGWQDLAGDIAGSDLGRILLAQNKAVSMETINANTPWKYQAPLSPDLAATLENTTVDYQGLLEFSKNKISQAQANNEILLIEGVGGVMVPLAPKITVLDWMAALSIPVILVTGSYLGALSHTLTAIKCLQTANVELMAVVINQTPDSTVSLKQTKTSLSQHIENVPLIPLTYSDKPAMPGGINFLYNYIVRRCVFENITSTPDLAEKVLETA